MRVEFEPSGQASRLIELLQVLEADPAVRSLLVLGCDANGWTPRDLDSALQKIGRPILGGVFPGILHAAQSFQQGTLVVGLPFALDVIVSAPLDTGKPDRDDIWNGLQGMELPPQGSAIVFIDALSPRIQRAMGALYDELGMEIRCIGGGAGSLSFEARPCIVSNRGLLQGVGIVGVSREPLGVGVTHGWQAVDVSVQVTESDTNRVHSLNWMPAFDWYRKAVLEVSQRDVAEEDFFAVAKSHPLGILNLGGELVVRDLLSHEGATLVSVSEIPTHAMVRLLHGDIPSLLASAERCQELAQNNLGSATPMAGLAMDCISRALFLGEHLQRELASLWSSGFPMVGALTIGEITADGRRALEFHNKTTALGCFGRVP